MNEQMDSPEEKENLNSYKVTASNRFSGKNEVVGTFEIVEKGIVKFIPNT